MARISRFLFGMALLGWAGSAGAQDLSIRQSRHDFSSSGYPSSGEFFQLYNWASQDTNQVCIFCHAPHHALSTSLIWNRNLPSAANFTVYNSDTMDATASQPKSASLRCLSCHDGSVALDAFNAGRTWTPRMKPLGDVYYPGGPLGKGTNIGGNHGTAAANNLADDHPISFVYDNALAARDGTLAAPANVEAAGLPLFGTDPNAQTLECPTCHEVHRKYPFRYLLRRDVQDASELCTTCHRK